MIGFTTLRIKWQLAAILMIITIVMLLIIFLSYSSISSILIDRNIAYVNGILKENKDIIESNCSQFNKILLNIASSSAIQTFMLSENKYKSVEYDKELKKYLLGVMEFNPYILDIVIRDNNNVSYDLYGKTKYIDELGAYPEDTPIIYTGTMQYSYSDTEYNCIIAGINVISIERRQTGQQIGQACLIINTTALDLKLKSISESLPVTYYIIDRMGIIYSCNDPAIVGNSISEISRKFDSIDDQILQGDIEIRMNNYILTSSKVKYTEGVIVTVTNKNELLEGIASVQKETIVLAMFSVSMILILFMVVTRNIVNPLRQLMEHMDGISSSSITDANHGIELKGNREITILSSKFNSMMGEIRNLTNRLVKANSNVYETKLRQKHAELDYLRSQINPHFLYNTLEMMKGIALTISNDEIYEIAKSLGDIYKYSVKGASMVTLKQEIDMIMSYIHIQKMRFGNRIVVEYDIDGASTHCLIPKMILQPIVENAVYHGLEPMRNGGQLMIRTSVFDNILWISIEDNGVGIDADLLSEIQSLLGGSLTESDTAQNSRVGLLNVNARIRLVFGDQYGLEIDSKPSSGTQIRIKMPNLLKGGQDV